jgi:acetylglutamate kinase
MKSPELQASVINDLVLLSCVGLRPVMVHGGGPEINHWLGSTVSIYRPFSVTASV